MARTAEGRLLTQEHRITQAAWAAAAATTAVSANAHLLDLDDLDATTPTWSAVMTSDLAQRWERSRQVATTYLQRYQHAELDTTDYRIARPTLDVRLAEQSLLYAGPVLVKQLITAGYAAETAYSSAMSSVTGRFQTWVLAGGRRTITETARLDARSGRYRRVSDGSPCAFCAMLVARSIERYFSDPAFKAHRFCGCTAELVYGERGDQNPVSDIEDEWLGAYRDAASQLKGDGRPINSRNVLQEMRRRRPELFSDGVHTH